MPNWRLMDDEQLQEQLERAKKALIPIQEEIERRRNLTKEQKFAEYLHKKLCKHNDCGWYYEEAGSVEAWAVGNEHKAYYQKSMTLLALYGDKLPDILEDVFR